MKNSKERLYVAYGSNLNLEQMKHRCPTAEVVSKANIAGWRLRFRGGAHGAVATIEQNKDFSVPALVWRIQPDDELALDRYEGFPFLYRKEMLRVPVDGKRVCAMVYIMNEAGHSYGLPSVGYYNTIFQGYQSAGFDTEILRQAAEDSRGSHMGEVVRGQIMASGTLAKPICWIPAPYSASLIGRGSTSWWCIWRNTVGSTPTSFSPGKNNAHFFDILT